MTKWSVFAVSYENHLVKIFYLTIFILKCRFLFRFSYAIFVNFATSQFYFSVPAQALKYFSIAFLHLKLYFFRLHVPSSSISWWEILKHLCWTLLGMTELELFNTGMETPSDHLAQVLYAVFIIVALVLLVNMMIAVLSNTYERVQVRGLQYALNRKYSKNTARSAITNDIRNFRCY